MENFKQLDWEPLIPKFRATHATLEKMIRFRMILDPYPPEIWALNFNQNYPDLPTGVDSWFRSPGIIEVDCPLDLLSNVKRRLQTFVNEVNLWYESSVLPPLLEKEQEAIEQAKKLDAIVNHANKILGEGYPSGLFED